jgi:hypothetical protein
VEYGTWPVSWNGAVARRMHDDQLASDAELVGEILRDQQPQWADCAIREVSSTRTDHALYRFGDAVARVPLRETATRPIDTEFRWLPWLAERLLVEIPRPLARIGPSPQVSVPLVDPLMGPLRVRDDCADRPGSPRR